MKRRGIELAEISLDETGRVILSDAELDRACSHEIPLAGAGIVNGGNCSNAGGCQNSSNSGQCTNSAGACSGASNHQSCSGVGNVGS